MHFGFVVKRTQVCQIFVLSINNTHCIELTTGHIFIITHAVHLSTGIFKYRQRRSRYLQPLWSTNSLNSLAFGRTKKPTTHNGFAGLIFCRWMIGRRVKAWLSLLTH